PVSVAGIATGKGFNYNGTYTSAGRKADNAFNGFLEDLRHVISYRSQNGGRHRYRRIAGSRRGKAPQPRMQGHSEGVAAPAGAGFRGPGGGADRSPRSGPAQPAADVWPWAPR